MRSLYNPTASLRHFINLLRWRFSLEERRTYVSNLLEEPDNGLPLTPNQLKELNRIGMMIAQAEPLNTIENAWRHFAERFLEEHPPSEGESWEIDAFIQWLLREAYHASTEDLRYYMDKVQYYNRLKKQVRESVAALRRQVETLREMEEQIDTLEQQISSIEDDAQLADVDLQNMLQKQQQLLQMTSNISKLLQDSAIDIIRKEIG